MIENKSKGVRTYCYCDEIHVMFHSHYTAEFLRQLYKRGRKYGLCITGVTQNVGDLLSTAAGRGMVGNSDYLMMLNQYAQDLELLAEMLQISDEQMKFVVGADVGSGLLFAENLIVPFLNRFPQDSYLYELMSTKFGEETPRAEIERKIKAIMNGGTARGSGAVYEQPPVHEPAPIAAASASDSGDEASSDAYSGGEPDGTEGSAPDETFGEYTADDGAVVLVEGRMLSSPWNVRADVNYE